MSLIVSSRSGIEIQTPLGRIVVTCRPKTGETMEYAIDAPLEYRVWNLSRPMPRGMSTTGLPFCND